MLWNLRADCWKTTSPDLLRPSNSAHEDHGDDDEEEEEEDGEEDILLFRIKRRCCTDHIAGELRAVFGQRIKGNKKKKKSGDMAIAEYSHFRWLHSFWSHQESRHPVLGFCNLVPRYTDTSTPSMTWTEPCAKNRLWAANFVAKIHHIQIQWIYQKGALAI